MATNTLPTFRAHTPTSPMEPQFVVIYPHEGSTYVVGFDSFNDLLHKLTSYKDADDNYLDGEIINRIVDFSEESLEWNGRPPVAEAVVDSEPCRCDACTKGHNALLIARLRSDMRSQERRVTWALIVIGIVAWLV